MQSRCAQLEHSLDVRELFPAGQQKKHAGQTLYTHFPWICCLSNCLRKCSRYSAGYIRFHWCRYLTPAATSHNQTLRKSSEDAMFSVCLVLSLCLNFFVVFFWRSFWFLLSFYQVYFFSSVRRQCVLGISIVRDGLSRSRFHEGGLSRSRFHVFSTPTKLWGKYVIHDCPRSKGRDFRYCILLIQWSVQYVSWRFLRLSIHFCNTSSWTQWRCH